MDAAGGAVVRTEQRGERSRLRLRRPLEGGMGADPAESVIDTFLGGPLGTPAREPVCEDETCPVCEPVPGAPVEVKPLRLRCPRAAAVRIGVEPSGRVCLEVEVGAGASVSRVLGDLEEAERWLRSSAHAAAMAPVSGRVDMSQPVRRRVSLEAGAADGGGVGGGVGVGMLARAGVEVYEVGSGNRH